MQQNIISSITTSTQLVSHLHTTNATQNREVLPLHTLTQPSPLHHKETIRYTTSTMNRFIMAKELLSTIITVLKLTVQVAAVVVIVTVTEHVI